MVVDFLAATRLRAPMDEDQRELVDQLCTQAGMILEDSAPSALTSGKLTGRGGDIIIIHDETQLKDYVDGLGEQLARAQAFVRSRGLTVAMFDDVIGRIASR